MIQIRLFDLVILVVAFASMFALRFFIMSTKTGKAIRAASSQFAANRIADGHFGQWNDFHHIHPRFCLSPVGRLRSRRAQNIQKLNP